MRTLEADKYIERIERILEQTLSGGNDPDDSGSVYQAVKELGEAMIDLINGLKTIEI